MTKLVSVPEFEATALEAIPKLAASSRLAFRTHKTKNIRWRQVQLRKLYWALEDYGPHILNALMSDLHKSEYESLLTELDWVKNDCLFMLDNMEKFAKDDKLGSPQVPLTFSMMKLRVKKEPLGAVLIIGPYNYPIQLTLGPLIGAIAAGCTAVIKPSELTPATAAVIKALIENRLDTKAFAVVNGSIPEVNALMDEKWDKIMFTGSAAVGTIIAKKAAETLTPVCLELGGKNPAFVTKNANLALAARRLLWSKTLNVGQVCLAQNYVLVDKEVVSSFIEFLKAAYKEMFPQGARASADLSRVVNQRHFQRLKAMLDATKGKIVMGGDMDEADLFIEPTAVLVDSKKDSMVVDEAFGPIFAILPYNSLDEALNVAYSVHKTPLSLFSFGSDAENAKVLNEMTSGGATLNDSFFHASLHTVPFGGVGDSGMGNYRGKASFDCFTHFRTVAQTPSWMEKFIRVRYMPYIWTELKRVQGMTGRKPNFDRSGVVVRGLGYWASLLFRLGGKGLKGAFLRWLFVLVSGYAALVGLAARRA